MSDLFPNIVDRAPNFASIFYRNQPQWAAYQTRAAILLDDAYGPANGVGGAGTQFLFDVTRGGFYRSKSIRERGLGVSTEASARGQTRAMFDLDDLRERLGNPLIPPDNQVAFLRTRARVQGTTVFTTEPEGPILVLQPPGWFNVPRPALTLGGTAPDLGALAGLGLTPPTEPPLDCLEIRVPAYADSLIITNHGASPLYFSPSRGTPFFQVDPMSTISHTSGMADSLLLAANGANPTFSVLIATVAGQR